MRVDEFMAILFWLIAPCASALAFAVFYLRHGTVRRIAIPVCLGIGAAVWGGAAAAAPAFEPLRGVGLAFFCVWSVVGAPMASSYVAKRMGQPNNFAWAIATILTGTLALLLQLAIEEWVRRGLPVPPPRDQ